MSEPPLTRLEQDVLLAVADGYDTPDLASLATGYDRDRVEKVLRVLHRDLGLLKDADG